MVLGGRESAAEAIFEVLMTEDFPLSIELIIIY
jgi:hypothetical protein